MGGTVGEAGAPEQAEASPKGSCEGTWAGTWGGSLRKSSPGEAGGRAPCPPAGLQEPRPAEVDKPGGSGAANENGGGSSGRRTAQGPWLGGMRRCRAGRSVLRTMSPTLVCLLDLALSLLQEETR